MRSDFVSLCQGARESIMIPDIPLATIRKAARERSLVKPRKERSRWAGALFAGISALGLAAAAAALGTRISLSPSDGMMQLSFDTIAVKENPTDKDLREAAAQLDFSPVVLPAGLPRGSTPIRLVRVGSSALKITYNLPGAWRRSHHLLAIVLANPGIVASSPDHVHRNGEISFGRFGTKWMIGHEAVIVARSSLTSVELAHLRAAMGAAAADKL